jgi:hypothetical protein
VATAAQRRLQRNTSGALRPTQQRLIWTRARDRAGRALDTLTARPLAPELRAAIIQVEDALAAGDHVSGLL